MNVPNPRPGEDRRHVLDRAIEVREQEQERDEHERAAPQHVGDVHSALAELRKAGQGEEPADREDRRDRGDDEALEEEHPVVIPERAGESADASGEHTASGVSRRPSPRAGTGVRGRRPGSTTSARCDRALEEPSPCPHRCQADRDVASGHEHQARPAELARRRVPGRRAEQTAAYSGSFSSRRSARGSSWAVRTRSRARPERTASKIVRRVSGSVVSRRNSDRVRSRPVRGHDAGARSSDRRSPSVP